MTKIVSLVRPTRAEVVYAEGNFANAKTALESNGYKIASAGEIANSRIEQGKDADVSKYGRWTREGFIYVPKKGIFLVRNSPIMANAKEATECHRNGKEFYLTNEQVEESLKASIEIENSRAIPTKRFGENELTSFAFGPEAERYGEFLKEAGIKNMPIYLASTEEKPFARQLWFRDLGNNSVLSGSDRDLSYDDDGAFGVNASADEGSASAPRFVHYDNFFEALKAEGVSLTGNLEKRIIARLN